MPQSLIEWSPKVNLADEPSKDDRMGIYDKVI